MTFIACCDMAHYANRCTLMSTLNFVNSFVDKHSIASVIEFGSGDGNQLSLANYDRYLGYDVSPEAIKACEAKFSDRQQWQFKSLSEYDGEKMHLGLSLDVIFHLIEDDVFKAHGCCSRPQRTM